MSAEQFDFLNYVQVILIKIKINFVCFMYLLNIFDPSTHLFNACYVRSVLQENGMSL